jgi:hypothetical protein
MTLDMLLSWLALRQDLLVSEDEIWWSEMGPDSQIMRALRIHRKGVRLLLRWNDWSVCPARSLHAPYARYAGHGRYVCEACEFLEIAV